MTQSLEDNDDAPVGRILSRREVLALLAGLGGTLVAGCGDTTTPAEVATATSGTAATPTTAAQAVATASGTPLNAEAATAVAATPAAASPTPDTAVAVNCVVKPELTEGPYFVDEQLNRTDIRSNTATGALSEGVPLAVTFAVSQVASNACTPLQGAQVDFWHCDAAGVYSGVQGLEGTDFLRGYQLTDASGNATFRTIYPGWYSGRAVHIHFKIRTTGAGGAAYEFTSQLFFDDALSDQVYAAAPYAARGRRNRLNRTDNIFTAGGEQLLLNTTGDNQNGYSATLAIALDLSDAQTGADDGGGGPGRRP